VSAAARDFRGRAGDRGVAGAATFAPAARISILAIASNFGSRSFVISCARESHTVMSRAGGPRVARRQLSMWSRRDFFALDGRLLEAREEKRLIRVLREHVGTPSVVQELMIRRAARLLIVIGLLERRVIERPDELGDLACRQLVAFHNALRLTFSALGMERAKDEIPRIADYIKRGPGRPPRVRVV
jgi:hypothetical protein